MFWWVIWWHDGQSKRPLRQDKHGHYFLISHLLFVLQYFYHNFESCCWTIYTNRKIILHDVFVQLQSIFNSTNINHGQSYPIFGFWLKLANIFLQYSILWVQLIKLKSKQRLTGLWFILIFEEPNQFLYNNFACFPTYPAELESRRNQLQLCVSRPAVRLVRT